MKERVGIIRTIWLWGTTEVGRWRLDGHPEEGCDGVCGKAASVLVGGERGLLRGKQHNLATGLNLQSFHIGSNQRREARIIIQLEGILID